MADFLTLLLVFLQWTCLAPTCPSRWEASERGVAHESTPQRWLPLASVDFYLAGHQEVRATTRAHVNSNLAQNMAGRGALAGWLLPKQQLTITLRTSSSKALVHWWHVVLSRGGGM